MRSLMKQQRLIDKLQNEMGAAVLSYLSDPTVQEILLNPDGKLWTRHATKGFIDTNERLEATHTLQLIGSIADHSGLVVNETKPVLETELPILGYRFEGLIPPVVTAPCFTIRKASPIVFSLDDYIDQKVVTAQQADIIRGAIHSNDSLLITGGPATGKTTFANALLAEMVKLGNPNQRFILVEDTRELQCSASNTVPLKTTEFVNHDSLLKVTLRSSPDRIIIGECRGKEVLTLLKAWNTGTKGGLATIHSNSAKSALIRVSEMVQESGSIVSPFLICESINMVISLDFNEQQGRCVKEIVLVVGYKDEEYVFENC